MFAFLLCPSSFAEKRCCDRSTAGNEKVQTLAISTIRDAVSKMSIVEVMTSREELKEKVKKDITPIFTGWGMWLETVEILDVRVESKSLFDDMQYLRTDMLNFDTKADAHLSAEEAKLVASKALDTKRLVSQTEMAKKRADADAEQGIYAATQRLKREQGEAELEEARQAMTLAKMAKDQQIELQALSDRAECEDAAVKQALEVERIREDQAHFLRKQKFELEGTLTPTNLQMAGLESTAKIYSQLPLREVKLVSLGVDGAAGGGGLGSLLPQVAAASEAWTASQQ